MSGILVLIELRAWKYQQVSFNGRKQQLTLLRKKKIWTWRKHRPQDLNQNSGGGKETKARRSMFKVVNSRIWSNEQNFPHCLQSSQEKSIFLQFRRWNQSSWNEWALYGQNPSLYKCMHKYYKPHWYRNEESFGE